MGHSVLQDIGQDIDHDEEDTNRILRVEQLEFAITAHFEDHKSLAFAYAELVQAGFAEEHMSADFGTMPDEGSVPAQHIGLLDRLRRLAVRVRAHAAAPRHAIHHGSSGSADLLFEAGDRADEASAIVERHGGIVSA